MQAEQATKKAQQSLLEPAAQIENPAPVKRRWRFKAVGRGLRQGKEGQALVEFALTLPFLILLFVVLVELGLLIRSHMTVTSTVRESVRVVSARGNADPAITANSDGSVNGGNDTNRRVGQDADTVMVQNVNTSLQQESQNVTLLMTYRADATEDLVNGRVTDKTSGQQVSTILGLNGIGGPYGVFYDPNLSKYPFQEIFDYNLVPVDPAKPAGQKKVVFLPVVMSTTKCSTTYGTSSPAKPATGTALNPTPYAQAFCGDITKTTDTGTTGITRTVALGQKNATVNNITPLQGKPGWPSGQTCQLNVNGVLDYNPATWTTAKAFAVQCARYSAAPWYPSLRRALDVGLTPQTNSAVSGYYNNQYEDATQFGLDNPPSGNRAPDYAGVQINYNHPWFLSFFPGSLSLSDRAIKLMEPTNGSFRQPDAPTTPTP